MFDCVGFDLDPTNHRQSAFMTPDVALFWLTPGDIAWKTADNIVLSMASGVRPNDWRTRSPSYTFYTGPLGYFRYAGNVPDQMGMALEGASQYDSGNWTLRIIHDRQYVTATFEVRSTCRASSYLVVHRQVVVMYINTHAPLPIPVEVCTVSLSIPWHLFFPVRRHLLN